jgi:hypothetical protein
MAVNAQVAHFLKCIVGHDPGRQRPGEDAAGEIRLRPRRRLLARRRAERGTHPRPLALRSAGAAAVAHAGRVGHLFRMPVELQLNELPRRQRLGRAERRFGAVGFSAGRLRVLNVT